MSLVLSVLRRQCFIIFCNFRDVVTLPSDRSPFGVTCHCLKRVVRHIWFYTVFYKVGKYTYKMLTLRNVLVVCFIEISITIILLLSSSIVYSHSTSRMMRLLTDGGTPLLAIHRYAPISALLTLVTFNVSPNSFSIAA